MKDKRIFANPFRIMSPKLNSEALRIEELHERPVSSTLTLEEGLLVMVSKLIEMTRLIHEGFTTDSLVRLDACDRLAEEVTEQHKLLLANLSCSALVPPEQCKAFMMFPSHMERVGSLLKNLLEACRIRSQEGMNFSKKANEEVEQMFKSLQDMLVNFRDTLIAPNAFLLDHVASLADSVDQTCQDYELAHVERLLESICAPRSSSVYMNMLDSTKSLSRHVKAMVQKLRELADTAAKAT